jgi:hypothetical protein
MGNVRTGKTKLTVELLEEAVGLGISKDITVIDMAPRTKMVRGLSIGGRLSELTVALRDVRYLTPPEVVTPRLEAASAKELLSMVRLNAERIRPLIEDYVERPTPVLFINDVSIYLQSGSAEPVLAVAALAGTFIANGYYGEFFSKDHGTGVSRRERTLMELLASQMDVVVRLDSSNEP